MFLDETLLNLVKSLGNNKTDLCSLCARTAREDKMHSGQSSWIKVPRSPQNTVNQYCFSMPCLFVLISYHFKPLTEIRTNKEKIEAEAAKKLRTMNLGKTYWFL